ncbi:MAG: hypothetical protein WC755_08720 [Candidatus Woesearchaeota archaeon]|jgi:hypothetical protein
MKEIIKPTVLTAEGNLQYEPSVRSYCMLRIKKVILEFFGMHQVRDKKFSYKLEVFGYNYVSFKEKMDEITNQGKMVPVLLYLYEDDENETNKD